MSTWSGGRRARSENEAPDTAEGWYLRSLATLVPERALICAHKAVDRDPTHVLAWIRLTSMRRTTGDLDGALAGADRLIELDDDANNWLIFKGTIFVRQGRFRQAIDAFTDASANAHLAHTYRQVGEFDQAVECYDRILERVADGRDAVWHYFQRATPLLIVGRTEEALADCQRVRNLLGRPWYSDARAYLILSELGRPREASELLDAALRNVRHDWLRQIFRFLAGHLSPDELVAEALARNNLEQLCEAFYYAGEVCRLRHQSAEARQWFERCVQTGVEFDPDAAIGTPMNEYELARWRLESMSTGEPLSPSEEK